MSLILPLLLSAAAQPVQPLLKPGDSLPELRGEFLTGKSAVLPSAAGGKVALLLLGFSYDSRFAVEAWTGRFREEFGEEARVTFYEIPMIGGLARFGKWFIDGSMRRGTPKPDHEHVITVYGGADAWKQRLGVTDEKDAFLVLLDKTGKVAWVQHGRFDAAKFQALANTVRELMGR